MTRTPIRLKLRAAAAGLLLAAAPGIAADLPFPARTAAAEPDSFLLRKAEAALATDPVLSRVNLVVSVVDGVAVVGGPVPNATIPPRIEGVLANVPGLKVVKVSCWVPPSDDPFAAMVQARMTAPVPAAPPVPAISREPAQAVIPPLAMTPARGLAPSPAALAGPVAPPPTAAELTPVPVAPAREPGKVTTARVADPGPTAGFLLAPEPRDGRGSFGGGYAPPRPPVAPAEPIDPPAPAYQPIPAPAVPTRPVSEVRQPRERDPIAAARASDPRFAGLAVRFEGRTAVVSGRAARPADAWDFADAIRDVPGVARVVVGYVR